MTVRRGFLMNKIAKILITLSLFIIIVSISGCIEESKLQTFTIDNNSFTLNGTFEEAHRSAEKTSETKAVKVRLESGMTSVVVTKYFDREYHESDICNCNNAETINGVKCFYSKKNDGTYFFQKNGQNFSVSVKELDYNGKQKSPNEDDLSYAKEIIASLK